jgi:hypothetical protein
MPLPPELASSPRRAVRATELIEEYEHADRGEGWDGLQDAFAPVRSLVEGATALVSQKMYEHYRHTQARVVARVSVVNANAAWAFFCVAGTTIGAPHWVMLDVGDDKPRTRLDEIATHLRARLEASTEDLAFDDHAASQLEKMLNRLAAAERDLLPRRKQRALDEMQLVLRRYALIAESEGRRDLRDEFNRILIVFEGEYRGKGVDWNSLAERWLDLVRPAWYTRLLGRRRTRPLRLKDIRQDLLNEQRLDFETVARELGRIEALPPLHERVVSCILGLAP